MKHLKSYILIAILVIAILIRFWGLGVVPSSPDWDEAALAYNGYSILHTGGDEFGKLFPVVLESFGDYKPALYSYLTIPPIAFFGLNIFATRFPSALFGSLTVLAVYFIVEELFNKKNLALLTTALFAVSPWNIQFSRIAFEANTGLAFNVFAALFFLKGLKKPWFLLLSAVFLALNVYVYQSEKVFSPLFALALIIIYRKELFSLSKKYVISAFILGIIVVLPMVVYTIQNPISWSRAEGVSIFSSQTQLLTTSSQDLLAAEKSHNVIGEIFYNRRLVFTKEILSNYLSHYNFNWLFITGDIARHHAPDMGLLYLWDLPFFLFGIYVLVFSNFPKKSKALVFTWFLLAPTPAAVTTGVPHAVRSMNFLPTPQVFIALGITSFYIFVEKCAYFVKRSLLKKSIYLVIILLFLFNFIYYLDQYFVQTNYFAAPDWQYGFAQIVHFVQPRQNSYKKIIVDDQGIFSQSYIFFLFYLKYNPTLYQKEGGTQMPNGPQHFANYYFQPFNYSSKSNPDSLYIGSQSDFPQNVKPLYIVYYPGGGIAMEAVANK